MSKSVYVLGTGLSHDGSACLLKDGKILVAIEKERISRIKHDGGNDSLAVQYCLNAAGINKEDLSLLVQCANFEKEEIKKDRYKGQRLFNTDCIVPFVTISHHLAHAWSAAGTCPFDNCNIMVIEGCGRFYHQCDDLNGSFIPADVNSIPGLYGEKDSFYFYNGNTIDPLYKYFSIIRLAIGAAHVPPYPAFSTITAIANLGFTRGAKQTNNACSFPCGFCAVPVLPQTIMLSNLATRAVPASTTRCIPSITTS